MRESLRGFLHLTLLEDVDEAIRIVQERLVRIVHLDTKPASIDIAFVSTILFFESGLTKDLGQALDDISVNLFVLSTIDSDLSWLQAASLALVQSGNSIETREMMNPDRSLMIYG